jgi:hypothetical protein
MTALAFKGASVGNPSLFRGVQSDGYDGYDTGTSVF